MPHSVTFAPDGLDHPHHVEFRSQRASERERPMANERVQTELAAIPVSNAAKCRIKVQRALNSNIGLDWP